MSGYITEVEKQATTAKSTELKNWKKQEVYVEQDDINQSCISAKGCSVEKLKRDKALKKLDFIHGDLKSQKISPQFLE